MKRTLSIFALGLLMLSGCSFGKDDPTPAETSSAQETDTSTSSSETASNATKEKSCKDSGGSYKNGTCTCPDDTYGPNDTLIYTYNAKTGHCEDPDGAPGGILGTDGKGADL